MIWLIRRYTSSLFGFWNCRSLSNSRSRKISSQSKLFALRSREDFFLVSIGDLWTGVHIRSILLQVWDQLQDHLNDLFSHSNLSAQNFSSFHPNQFALIFSFSYLVFQYSDYSLKYIISSSLLQIKAFDLFAVFKLIID